MNFEIERITVNASPRIMRAEWVLTPLSSMIIVGPKFKIPKQWKYWCRKYGLVSEGNRKSRYTRNDKCPYMIGHGHYWRVNMYNIFQISCPIANFDRWANSTGKEIPMPKSEKEFAAAIKELLNEG